MKKADPELLVFTSDHALQRVKKFGDIFEPVLKLKQKLPPLTALGQGDTQSMAEVPAAGKVKRIRSARSVRKVTSKTVAKTVKRKAKVR